MAPWLELFKKMVLTGSISFKRSCKPEDANMDVDAILVAYMDGSDSAKAFAAYLRYVLYSGRIHVGLLTARSKLNSAGGQSTPRSEMDGHTLGARGARTIDNAMKEILPRIKKIYFLGDSKTVLQALKMGATPFSEWFANRIGEVWDCMRDLPKDVEIVWGWVKSADNAADIASRINANPEDLMEGTEWQDGPAYLKLPEADWPIDTDIMEETKEIPKDELRRQFRHQAFSQKASIGHGIGCMDDLRGCKPTCSETVHELGEIAKKTNNWKKALEKTRNLTLWLEKVRTKNCMLAWQQGWITRLQLEQKLSSMANRYGLTCWLRHAGKATIAWMEKGKMKNMVITIRNNIPFVQTRFKVKTMQYFGVDELPLILASTELGYLLCQDAHEVTHRAGDLALSVTKQHAYILGAKKLLMSIRKRCTVCRKEAAKPMTQRMADVPDELQLAERAFKKIAVDLAGPYLVKADMRRRSVRKDEGTVKVWIAVVACSLSSAVKLYICKDYSEEGFMQVWQEHVSDWGKPAMVYSDRGSQLVAAAGGLDPGDNEDELDWAKLGRKTGVKWTFTSAQSQWKNGRAEALVKCTKHSLRTTFKHTNMNILDFQAVLKQISFILNSRPIELILGVYSRQGGAQEEDSSLPENWSAITPNDLILGDSGDGCSRNNYHTGLERLSDLDKKVQSWHEAWVAGCQDVLFQRDARWTEKTRNLKVGDIVWMIQESKIARVFKWGLVKSTIEDLDGVVRTVFVRYALVDGTVEPYVSPYSKKGPFKLKRCSVQNLALFYARSEQEEDKARFGKLEKSCIPVDILRTEKRCLAAVPTLEQPANTPSSVKQFSLSTRPVTQKLMMMRMVAGRAKVHSNMIEEQSNPIQERINFPDTVETLASSTQAVGDLNVIPGKGNCNTEMVEPDSNLPTEAKSSSSKMGGLTILSVGLGNSSAFLRASCDKGSRTEQGEGQGLGCDNLPKVSTIRVTESALSCDSSRRMIVQKEGDVASRSDHRE